MKSIKVTVSPKGEAKVEAFGFQGTDCLAATAGILKAISGGEVTSRELKPEAMEVSGSPTVTQG